MKLSTRGAARCNGTTWPRSSKHKAKGCGGKLNEKRRPCLGKMGRKMQRPLLSRTTSVSRCQCLGNDVIILKMRVPTGLQPSSAQVVATTRPTHSTSNVISHEQPQPTTNRRHRCGVTPPVQLAGTGAATWPATAPSSQNDSAKGVWVASSPGIYIHCRWQALRQAQTNPVA